MQSKEHKHTLKEILGCEECMLEVAKAAAEDQKEIMEQSKEHKTKFSNIADTSNKEQVTNIADYKTNEEIVEEITIGILQGLIKAKNAKQALRDPLLRALTSKDTQHHKEQLLERLRSHKRYETGHDTTDPIACEIVRIQNIGFEEAHKLHSCGHSVGDFRDPNYGTDKYDGDERCVACEQLLEIREKVREKEMTLRASFLDDIMKSQPDGQEKEERLRMFELGYNRSIEDIDQLLSTYIKEDE